MREKKLYKNKEWLCQKYCVENLTMTKIAKICGLKSDNTILLWMNKFEIKRRNRSDAQLLAKNKHDFSLINKLYRNKKWLYKKYEIEKLSSAKIGKICKIGHQTILNQMNKLGVKTRNLSDAQLLDKNRANLPFINKSYQDKGWLIQKYCKEKLSLYEMGKICGIAHTGIEAWMKKFGISRRTDKEKMKILWKNPEYIKKILKAKNIKPTKPEKTFNEMTPYNVRYVGNGAWWRKLNDGKYHNPDFKITGQNKIIEVFGDYWHKNDNTDELIDLYKQVGLDCLIVWENEIYKQPELVKIKVNNFLSGGVIQ